MEKNARLKILHLQLEFSRWEQASHWSYTAQFSLDEGFEKNGVDVFTVNSTSISHLWKFCRGRKFDQIWLEIVHQPLDEEILGWIAGLAPVRVGFICESLEYLPEDYLLFPELEHRKLLIENRLKYLTHVMVTDERDVTAINSKRLVPAMWWLPSIPERFVYEKGFIPSHTNAVFSGAVYGERANWLSHPGLKGLLVKHSSSESGTPYPMLYDALHLTMHRYLKYVGFADRQVQGVYMYAWNRLRGICFSRWLKSMREGCAVVNLPSCVKAYAGRVVEGMSAGVPVISWEVPDRPRTKSLFEEGKEILLYSKGDPSQLADHIRRIQTDRVLSQKLTISARNKIKHCHTAELRVREILRWIETGEVPGYE